MHINRVFHVKQADPEAIAAAFGCVVPPLRHDFEPHGLTVAWVGPDATVMVHTWPEHGLLTLDVYGLGELLVDQACATLGWREAIAP